MRSMCKEDFHADFLYRYKVYPKLGSIENSGFFGALVVEYPLEKDPNLFLQQQQRFKLAKAFECNL